MTIHPVYRLTLGLLFVSVSILFVGELLGVVPDERKATLEHRKQFCESLAVLFTGAVEVSGDVRVVSPMLETIVERNSDVLSAGIRLADGSSAVQTAGHEQHWRSKPSDRSTSSEVQVPILRDGALWGTVEVRFAPIGGGGLRSWFASSIFGLIALFAVTAPIAYFLYLRRALKELDPSSVIPERVSAAFNALSEGVLLLDEHERVVLINNSLLDKVGSAKGRWVGHRARELPWSLSFEQKSTENWDFPWAHVLRDGNARTGSRLALKGSDGGSRAFSVNASPILANPGKIRGALVTLDDVSVIETTNEALQEMLAKLKDTELEVRRQNNELERLAMRDPLTDCLNRRSLTTLYESILPRLLERGEEVFCVMADIDFFKKINDTYGHDVGDEVIKLVAQVLKNCFRARDLIGRWGGEEFCIILSADSMEEAAVIAERVRETIVREVGSRLKRSLTVTASFGVSALSTDLEASDIDRLVKQADEALYFSKRTGRNRVTVWNKDLFSEPLSARRAETAETTQKAESGPVTRERECEPDSAPLPGHAPDIGSGERLQVLRNPSTNDLLTGLPTREIYFDRLRSAIERCRRSNLPIAVLSLMTGVYQQVNDTLGHYAADQVLIEAGKRLEELVRASDSLALLADPERSSALSRVSSEEFAILLPDLKTTEIIGQIVQRIMNAFDAPIHIADQPVQAHISIGVSIFPLDGEDPDVLMRCARIARHHAQNRPGIHKCNFFREDMNEAFARNLVLEAELRRSIEESRFELKYQPRMKMASGRITAVEALIRWNHPVQGRLAPDSFIALAESSGLIVPLGMWVIKQAVAQVAKWQALGFPDLIVGVNLSPVQFRDENLIAGIVSTLQEHGVPPNCLELEITENAVAENQANATEVIRGLRNAGVRVAIDDFGTGYSVFNQLKRFPVDIIKVDRSFISDITFDQHDFAIVSAIVTIAGALDAHTVAEGVETHEQFGMLRRLGCDELQGYIFSRPLDPEACGAFLIQNRDSTSHLVGRRS